MYRTFLVPKMFQLELQCCCSWSQSLLYNCLSKGSGTLLKVVMIIACRNNWSMVWRQYMIVSTEWRIIMNLWKVTFWLLPHAKYESFLVKSTTYESGIKDNVCVTFVCKGILVLKCRINDYHVKILWIQTTWLIFPLVLWLIKSVENKLIAIRGYTSVEL